jgi:hypothetical protein
MFVITESIKKRPVFPVTYYTSYWNVILGLSSGGKNINLRNRDWGDSNIRTLDDLHSPPNMIEVSELKRTRSSRGVTNV